MIEIVNTTRGNTHRHTALLKVMTSGGAYGGGISSSDCEVTPAEVPEATARLVFSGAHQNL